MNKLIERLNNKIKTQETLRNYWGKMIDQNMEEIIIILLLAE